MSDTYRPSGRFDPVRMTLLLPPAIALALLVGYLETLVFHAGFYILGLVPIVAGFLVAGGVFAVVAVGRCRNRLVGGLTGLALGLLMHAAYYHFDFIRTFNQWDRVLAVNALPHWIHFRVLTDEQKKVGVADRPNAAAGPPVGAHLVVRHT